MSDSEDYDVVVDVLTKHAQTLWKMTERNMQSEYVGMNNENLKNNAGIIKPIV